ncbi:inorganic phosphate transporter [Fervidobacterium sp. 2310opik-2]|uniref:inorganic phosphate transporter n=1 Tax=Fervidobacterium sp. 2310opik-2 TaxID=1755815 RepID=UPI0013DEFDE9|nr:inorganic phosphate transporter [Fervidobacterium sp. 2310opik-2]KAF2960913.1 phosphate transporter [Fervidobacterium sp. 2310opik-2]
MGAAFVFFLLSFLLGIVMGSNDAGNILGPTVANGVFKQRKALIVSSIFVIAGAMLGGLPGMRVASSLVKTSIAEAIIINLSVISVTIYFLLNKLPISMTQVIVGANVGIGIVTKELDPKILLGIVFAWFLTPVISYTVSFAFFKTFSIIFKRIKNLQSRNILLMIMLWGFTIYGSYSLGANNAGKITGILYNKGINVYFLLFFSGITLALGIFLFGKRTIYTVGKELIPLDSFSSMVCIFSSSFSIWFFSQFGLPVSSAHAIVGSILGSGTARGTKIVNKNIFQKIVFSWIEAPILSGLFSALLLLIYRLLW